MLNAPTQVSSLLLNLAERLFARLSGAASEPRTFQETNLAATVPALRLRALVARIAEAGGQGAVFGIGADLSRLDFSPALHLLETAPEPGRLARRWQRLELAWGIRHLTQMTAGAAALHIDCLPNAGAAAPLMQNLTICGAVAGLMRAQGYRGIAVSARRPDGRWRDIDHDGEWQHNLDAGEGAASFRIEWTNAPAAAPKVQGRPLARHGFAGAVQQAIESGQLARQSPRDLADRFGESLRTLNRRLQACGTSTGALYRTTRMRAACLEIAQGAESLTRVAYAAGFADSAHLSREFRKASGLTPRQYRQTIAQS